MTRLGYGHGGGWPGKRKQAKSLKKCGQGLDEGRVLAGQQLACKIADLYKRSIEGSMSESGLKYTKNEGRTVGSIDACCWASATGGWMPL